MANDSLNISAALLHYLREYGVREDPLLKRLRDETAQDAMSIMQIGPEQGQFMQLLVRLMDARRIIEVGTFTGYSSLCLSLAMPEGGHLDACDVSEQWTAIAQRYWQEAGVAGRITLHLAPASETLEGLLKVHGVGSYDLAFIDADKANYESYYERCLQLLRPGGLLLLDNVLWGGSVIVEEKQDESTQAIRSINEKLKRDERVHLSMIPLGDGLTLALKK